MTIASRTLRTLTCLQEAEHTIEALRTQVLDLEIKLNQAKAALADFQYTNRQDTQKLQEQLRQAELKAASKSVSDSALKALTLNVHQLRSKLQTQVSNAAAADAASQEASLAGKMVNLQEKLQQAEAKAASSVELSSKVAEMTQELDRLQTALSEAEHQMKGLKSSAAEAEEEHQAALQVRLFFHISYYQSSPVVQIWVLTLVCSLVGQLVTQ